MRFREHSSLKFPGKMGSSSTNSSGRKSASKRLGGAQKTHASLNKTTAEALASMSILYREVVAEREEILRHKWLLSEKAGHDVGFNSAAYDWISNHRAAWRKAWRASQKMNA